MSPPAMWGEDRWPRESVLDVLRERGPTGVRVVGLRGGSAAAGGGSAAAGGGSAAAGGGPVAVGGGLAGVGAGVAASGLPDARIRVPGVRPGFGAAGAARLARAGTLSIADPLLHRLARSVDRPVTAAGEWIAADLDRPVWRYAVTARLEPAATGPRAAAGTFRAEVLALVRCQGLWLRGDESPHGPPRVRLDVPAGDVDVMVTAGGSEGVVFLEVMGLRVDVGDLGLDDAFREVEMMRYDAG